LRFAPHPISVGEKLSCFSDILILPYRQGQGGRLAALRQPGHNRSCLRLCLIPFVLRANGTSVCSPDVNDPRRTLFAPFLFHVPSSFS
jgi:hypothetical protein